MKTRSRMMPMCAATLAVGALALLGVQPAECQQTGPTASIQTVSDTAAATLLGPYFEVDLSNPTGMNTIFTIGNTGAPSFFTSGMMTFVNQNGPTAVLAHVSVWSDLGVPVFNFNIYLTGYDLERIDMRALLTGTLPRTATAGQDPNDTISPKGRFSQDINFASCTGGGGPGAILTSYPPLPPGALTAAQIANLQSSLTGNASTGNGGKCAGANHGDNIARGYITIDTVNSCSAQFPGDPGYFTTTITDQSFQLTGETYYVDQLHAIARGENMVHIHASSSDPLTTTSGNYTFYGRLNGFTATDHRQPLATTFTARFLNGNFNGAPAAAPSSPAWGVPPASPPPGSTNLVVWRDPKTPEPYFTCGSLPSPYPLGQEGIVAFDDQEHPQTMGSGINPPLATFGSAFPIATQVVPVGGSALPTSYTSGWLFLNLNHTNAPGPTSDTAAAQAWVQVIEQNGSQIFNVMHRAQAQDSATKAVHYTPH